jgi:hypothetical protein
LLVRIELLTRRQQEESAAAESSPNAQKSKPARVNSAAQNMRPEQHSGTTPNHNRRDSLLRGEREQARERESHPLIHYIFPDKKLCRHILLKSLQQVEKMHSTKEHNTWL